MTHEESVSGNSGHSPLWPPFRSKSRIIRGGEWRLAIQLAVGSGTDEHTVEVGQLRYADSFLAQNPQEVGRLVALHLASQAESRVKKGKRTK